ncbi:putative bacilysin exporter BacE [Streptomyces sp. MBT84]|nr:putative bacilysin exporter BacE [Streptomyces sp. MBT84]
MPHRLLRNRAFQLLFLGRSLSLVGDAVVPAALSLAVLRATGSTSALALVLGCSMVPRLLLLPLGGVVADRFNARTVALTTDLVRGATQLCIGFQLLSNTSELWQIASASAVGGAASAFAMPTLPRLITGTVPDTDRQAANSALGVVRSATGLGGPALAGVLILTVGPGWAFILDASSFAVSASLLAVIRIAHVPVGHSSLRTDLVEGWQEVRSRDWYWTSLIAHAVWNGAAAVLTTLGPALAIRQLGGEQTWVEILQAGAVGLLLGSLLAGRAHPAGRSSWPTWASRRTLCPSPSSRPALQLSPLSSPTASPSLASASSTPSGRPPSRPPSRPVCWPASLRTTGFCPWPPCPRLRSRPARGERLGPAGAAVGRGGRGGRGLRRNCRRTGRAPLPGHGQHGQLPHTGDHRK